MVDRRWAKPILGRHQGWLFSSLDEMVAQDHVIRVIDAVLAAMDWSAWEARFLSDRRGQPPIHPMLLAGCILYGLTRRIRSSRELEDATRERLDFQWFMVGRAVDHSTFAAFRVTFKDELKALNRQMVMRICAAHESALAMPVVDGTRLRANSDRHGARTAEGLQRLFTRCAEMLNERLERMEAVDDAQQLGATPQRVMADTGFGCGENLEQLTGKGIEACMPTGTDFRPSTPPIVPMPRPPCRRSNGIACPWPAQNCAPVSSTSSFEPANARGGRQNTPGAALTPSIRGHGLASRKSCAQGRNRTAGMHMNSEHRREKYVDAPMRVDMQD